MVRLAIFLVLFGTFGLAEAQTTSAPVAESVRRGVEQLGSSGRVERQQAEERLSTLGPEALEFFPAGELVQDPEVREALRRIRFAIESRVIEAAQRPTRVTVSGDYTPARLAEVIRQITGNQVLVKPTDADWAHQPIQILWNNLTFWSALADLETRGFAVRPSAGAVILEKTVRDPKVPVFASRNSGPFRWQTQQVALREDRGRWIYRINGMLLTEPRLQVLLVQTPLERWTVRHDRIPLGTWVRDTVLEIPIHQAGEGAALQADFFAKIAPPAFTRDHPETVDVAPYFVVDAAAFVSDLSWDNLAEKRVLRRKGQVSGMLMETQPDESGGFSLKLRVSYETGGPAFESHRTWIMHNAAWLSDRKQPDSRIAPSRFDIQEATDGAIEVVYHFPVDPAATAQYRFFYRAPAMIFRQSIRFESDQQQ